MNELITRIHNFVPRNKTQNEIFCLLDSIYYELSKIIILPPREKVEVKISKLLKKRSGFFTSKIYRNGQTSMKITLSKSLLIDAPNSGANLAKTWIHENIHVSSFFCFVTKAHGYERGHGPIFEKKMCLVNLFFKGLGQVRITHNYPIPNRYAVTCSKCHCQLRKTINRGPLRRNLYHIFCGGKLVYEPLSEKEKK